MEEGRVMLGDVSLEKYISRPREMSDERRREIDELIKRLENRTLNVEQLPLLLLKAERAQYSKLDPNFLSMSSVINYRGNEILVPRFSVYRKTDEGFGDFRVRLCNDSTVGIWSDNNHLPSIFGIPIAKSTGFYKQAKSEVVSELNNVGWYTFRKLPLSRRIRNWFREEIEIKSEFDGIFPVESKIKIGEAKKVFGHDLYLIAETKPEAWNVRTITKDPLLVGTTHDRCYLVDKFDTTPLEDYIAREFSS